MTHQKNKLVHTNQISICVLDEASSKEEALIKILNTSKSKLKKYLPKAFLQSSLRARDELSLPLNLVNDNKIFPIYEGEKIEILFENEKVLALNKPPKIHMHPLTYDERDNLLSFLKEIRRGNLLNVNVDKYDRGLLYRLDYETSGVVLYSKSNELYKDVREGNTLKEKIYLAIVSGRVLRDQELHNFMSPSFERGKKMKEDPKGREALSELKLISYNEEHDLSLVQVKLITGVRHQIRFQLQSLGHPVLGDELYEGRKEERLFLHAYKYSIEIQGELLNITAPVPKLFFNFFDFN